MYPASQTNSDEKVIRLLKAAHILELQEAPREHSQRTPTCPSLPRFTAARTQGWNADEQRHLEACAYCQKVLAMFERAAAAAAGTAVSGDTGTHQGASGFTTLYRMGHVHAAEMRLRSWLPLLFQWVGLCEKPEPPLVERFLEFVRARRGELQSQRFRERLPVWLREFARQEHVENRLRDHLLPTPAELEAGAVQLVLATPAEKEAAWVRVFREAAQASRLTTTRALLNFAPPGAQAPALPNYRRELFLDAQRTFLGGLDLFECEEGSCALPRSG